MTTTRRPPPPPPLSLTARRQQVLQRRQVALPSPMRLVWLAVLLGAGQVLLLGRLIYLQAYNAKNLQARAAQQQQRTLDPLITRYPIVDRNQTLLAADQLSFILYVHPKLFNQSQAQVAAKLAPLLNQPVDRLVKRFQEQPTGIRLIDELSEATAAKVRELNLDGLELDRQWGRVYPQQELMAGIVGYVDRDHHGQAGLEYSQQQWLQAPLVKRRYSRDGQGLLLPDLAPQNPSDPNLKYSLRLTLDTRLQRVTRQALEGQLRKYQALRGTTIVMDIHNGAILALVSEPSYNPSRYYEADTALFRNWAVSDLYEPGSTFKPVNTAIALENKVIQPSTTLYDEGRIFIDGWPIQNNDFSSTGGRGPLNIAEVLGYSSNVGMVHMMQRLKPSTYYQYLQKLGLGAKLGTDLPFETPAQLKPRQEFVDSAIEPATTAFGQGFSLTPLQMTQLIAATVNGGKLVTPHVISGLYDRSGKLAKANPLPPPRQVFSPATSKAIIEMLGYVVSNGTGKPAQIPGYRLGGKTGTAQKAVGGAYRSLRITSFAGVFPLESPRYVVFTVVDEPKGDNAFGSTVAVPVVKAVIESLITIEGIPPSHPEELQVRPPVAAP